ncbi:calcium homeostasis endoplasmic reticulum protein, related [Neospora caninum Liverpool]|uniref:Calcium homeostasis endoplasmic reticulum protein, related n=2 Tax=Neospora caninum (strain Liverpool) TaxID=572307 RepID=F0V8B0_NEOCL|nr:calcium homeostasis endoplasmic reticulum protein, related [Neospora caninum Liverpool]CBZ49951.1 calcium homeostasis endoplasmic reticulum protein, related [Neospora caninum Liverpool]|eukprot:XP_003879986.1 calcium homeostasis endoplasmic reticulum protein, related [Neospora caninum Liverpool]
MWSGGPSPYGAGMQQTPPGGNPGYSMGASGNAGQYVQQSYGQQSGFGQAHGMYSQAGGDYMQTPTQTGYAHSASPYQQQGRDFSQGYSQQAAPGGSGYAASPGGGYYGAQGGMDYNQQYAAPPTPIVYSPPSASYRDGSSMGSNYYSQQGSYQGQAGYDQSAGYGVAPVRPPADPELVKRIHTIAEYCCRNPEMESLVRQRDGADPRFAFINGGEGYDYFRFAIACLQQGLDPTEQAAAADQGGMGSSPAVPYGSALNTGGEETGDTNELTREFDIDSLIMQYQEPPERAALPEALSKELNDVVLSLEKQATSTAIRNGRHWIEVNGGASEDAANSLACALKKKQTVLSSFLHKLNVLYLVHDVVQNESIHKPASVLLTAFKPYLVWMLRDAYQAAARDPSSAEKVEKILSLWVKRGIIDEDEQEEMNFLMSSPDVGKYLNPNGDGDPQAAFDLRVSPGGFPDAASQGRHPFMKPSVSPGYPGGPMGENLSPGQIPPPPPPRPGNHSRIHGGFDRRPDEMGNTPESVPVGMMATMLRSMSKRAKNMQTAFVPYRALDPLTTPQQLPPLEPPSDYMLDRIRDFYEDLEEIEEKLNRQSDRERRMREVKRGGPAFDKPASWVNSEMGVGDDGSFAGHPGLRGARLGLGAAAEVEERMEQRQPPPSDDPFEMFRRQRAGKYHDIIASNKAAARMEQQSQRFADKNCYVCGKMGHIARDCPAKAYRKESPDSLEAFSCLLFTKSP